LAKDAFEYQKLPAIIDDLNKEIKQINKDLEEYNIKADNIVELRDLYKQYVQTYEQVSPRTNQLFIYFVNTYGSLVHFVKNSNLNAFTTATTEFIDSINDAVYTIQEISKIETELQNLNYKKNISENNESIKSGIENSIKEKEADAQTIKDSIKVLNDDLTQKSALLSSEKNILADYSEHLAGRRERASLATMISTLSDAVKNYSDKKQAINDKQLLLNTANFSFEDLRKRKLESSDSLIKAKTTLINIENLKSKKESLDADYSNLKLIKDALDPNKGVPLYFIKAYLEKTKDIANELLELAFGENFEINFVTSDKEFFIQVRAGENVKNDIKEASQGEVALTTISISLSLIEQAIGEYNILSLDEIDGPLDNTNRENFISILNTQINKLGIEQVFVISHNDAFDTEEMDLILLRDHNASQKGEEFMRNKEVIFEVK
jgi:hypothetical protein